MTEANATAAPESKTCLTVSPGICGFDCTVYVRRLERRRVSISIDGSQCGQIQRLDEKLDELSLKDLFTPLSRNPVYKAAEKSGCHLSCVIPAAIIKAGEVAMEMALPRDVQLRFDCAES